MCIATFFRQMRLHGMTQEALDRIRKYWGKVLADGVKTIYEMAIAKFGHDWQECGHDGSLCHGFGTSPLEFLQAAILGVEPIKPGFAEFRCVPYPADLQFAQGRIPTPRGNIRVSWKRLNNNIGMDVTVPDGTTAVLQDGTRLTAGQHQVSF